MFEEFKQLGFTDKEVKVYLCLIMLGKSNVQQICQRTSIFRTSVYSVLGRLIEKGLVSKTVEEKAGRQVEHFMPNDPAILFDHIEHERISLADKETVARRLILRIAPQLYPKVCYQAGSEQVRQSLKDFFADVLSSAIDKEQGKLFIYLNPIFYAEYASDVSALLEKVDLSVQLLMTERSVDDAFTDLSHVTVCTIPERLAPSTTLLCYTNVALLVVCQADSEQPHYAFSIKDETIAQDCQRLLSSLWNNMKEKQGTGTTSMA